MSAKKSLDGIHAATVAPLKNDFSIDHTVLKDHIMDVCSNHGIKGLLINGHAGENHILSQDEQVELVKITRSVVSNDTLIVSGLNAECSKIGSEVAKKMIDNGADSIMIFPPFSWGLSYDEDLILGKAFKEGKLADALFDTRSEYLSVEKPRLDFKMKETLSNMEPQ